LEKTFDIFVPNDKKPFPLVAILIATPILLLFLHFGLKHLSIEFMPNNWLFIVSFCLYAFLIARAIVLRNAIRPLNGKLIGKIKFLDTEIYINNKKIDLAILNKIDFHFGDYYSELKFSHNQSIKTYRENGTNNWIILKFKDGEERKVQFQRWDENIEEHLAQFFEFLYHRNLISFLRLTELRGIKTYEEIQEYKQTLNPK
jgi:hypothetical protein